MPVHSTAELIVMAENPAVSDQTFAEAFMHYTPGLDSAYTSLLKVVITKRRTALRLMGVTLRHVRHTRTTLLALQQRHQKNFAS